MPSGNPAVGVDDVITVHVDEMCVTFVQVLQDVYSCRNEMVVSL